MGLEVALLMKKTLLSLAFTCLFSSVAAHRALAHPGAAIAVDANGRVYFVDTGHGVWTVDAAGKLVDLGGPAYHWMALDPEADAQQLRTLIRQARKDAQAVKERPGEAQRHGKAYREIFQHVKAALARGDGDEPGEKE